MTTASWVVARWTDAAGVLANGRGPVVLLPCELDALPLREDTAGPISNAASAPGAFVTAAPASVILF